MKNKILAVIGFSALTCLLSGCSGAFWAGTGTGTVGTGAAYEIHARSEMNRINDELKSGKITQEEYNIRQDQIGRDSLFQ